MPLLNDFLSDRPDNTRRAYENDLEAFRTFTSASSVLGAIEALMDGGYSHTQEQFARYQEYLLGAGKSRATTARYIACVRSVLLLARKKELISWVPPVRPPFPPAYRDTATGDPAGFDHILRGLSVKSSSIEVRDYAIVLLMGRLALRRSEVATLRVDEISVDRAELTVRRQGEKRADVLQITEEVLKSIQRWVALRGDWPGPMFVAIRNGAIKRSGVTDRTIARVLSRYKLDSPRALRHLAITAYLERTDGDISGAMELGRVRRSSTMRTYEMNRQSADRGATNTPRKEA